MSSGLQIINPLQYAQWDSLVSTCTHCSFFHTASWARTLYDTYGYKPRYFVDLNGERLNTLIPLMEINSFLTGRRGVSLPFSDYCELMIGNRQDPLRGLQPIIDYAKAAHWKLIQLRPGRPLVKDTRPSALFYGHTLQLCEDADNIFNNFRSSTRRNIKKAIKNGVVVDKYNSMESVREYYRLHCLTRKRHGVPPQPFHFFRNIFRQIISKKLGFVVLAAYDNRYIAGAVYFHTHTKAYYKYGASDSRFQALRASNLVMWEAIRWYARNGFESFCFGRTEPDNPGLLQFKDGWGAEQKNIFYYTYNMKRDRFVTDDFARTSGLKKLFSRMPAPLLRLAGSILYRHFA